MAQPRKLDDRSRVDAAPQVSVSASSAERPRPPAVWLGGSQRRARDRVRPGLRLLDPLRGRAPTRDFGLLLIGAPFVVLAIFASGHLYEAYRFAPAEEFRRIILAVSASIAVVMLLSFWLKADLSRAWVGTSWALALLFALTARRLWHARFGHLRERGTLAFRTVVVGTNDEAERLLDIMSRPAFGFRPIGVVATDERPRDLGLPCSARSRSSARS
jgi:hypothetical protein